jgi:glycosyltransferase involved in cell wall biosynthesis
VATPAATTERDGRPPLSVAWAGPTPRWLDAGEARSELGNVELHLLAEPGDGSGPPDLAHVTKAALGELRHVRRALPESALVLDLTGEGDTELSWRERRQARLAEAVLAGSGWELGELRRRLSRPLRTVALERPLDLDWHAPEPVLAEAKGRGRDLRRFRRFHRLAGPVVLFAGPFTEAGGLDVLVEVVFGLRERMPDLRLAAIPHGSIDPRYRDRLEMRILGLGHHGIVEWSPPDSEIPFWYATAAVVCAPAREPVSPEPAKYAAAAARPFVGSDLEPFREQVEDGMTGRLVPAHDRDALERVLEEFLGDRDEQARIGEAARRKAKAEYSPATAARALRREWAAVLDELGARGGRVS